MFVELLESLRCPREHEAAPLVASATRTEHRHILEGVLGCPVCEAEFPIRDGVLRLGEAPRAAAEPASPEMAMRIAAFLELSDARGFALLCGSWGAQASALAQLTETPVVLVNPPEGIRDGAAVIVTPDRLPFAPGSARGAALDSRQPRELVESALVAVRDGGRVMGPAVMPVPDHLTEIARDDRHWLAERVAASPPVSPLITLVRSRPAQP